MRTYNVIFSISTQKQGTLFGGTVCCLLIFLSLFSVSIYAWGDKQASLGGREGFVERMGGGVREQGLGNVGVADFQAQPGAFWNPALVASSRFGTDIVMGG